MRIGHARDGIAARLIIARKPRDRAPARAVAPQGQSQWPEDRSAHPAHGRLPDAADLVAERAGECRRGGQAVPHALSDRAGIQAAEEPRRLRRVARQRPQAGPIVAAGPPDRRGPDRGFAGRSARTLPPRSNASASSASGTARPPSLWRAWQAAHRRLMLAIFAATDRDLCQAIRDRARRRRTEARRRRPSQARQAQYALS